ncbi:MAG TPA: hypothetical protein VG815_20475 [Chloroflexota bacterium]|nr:hypothetical protein [Chloroflexota bacterium]
MRLTGKRTLRLREYRRISTLLFAFGVGATLLSGCMTQAGASVCHTNVAAVGSTSISRAEYNRFLQYTLAFYEKAYPSSRYFGKSMCTQSSLAKLCRSIKVDLQSRMIDQQIVSEYAAAHGLLPDSTDWNTALQQERQIARNAGGEPAFIAYLAKLKTDQAQFRFLESQEIETTKVIHSMTRARFTLWLNRQEHAKTVVRCSV